MIMLTHFRITEFFLIFTASVKTHEKLEKKFVFKVPSEDVLKRDTAHPVPCTKRVPVIEGRFVVIYMFYEQNGT